MRKLIFGVVLGLLLMAVPFTTQAEDWIGGKIETGVQVNSGDEDITLKSTFNVELDLEKSYDNAGFFLALKGEGNTAQFQLAVDEAYVDYYAKSFDLRVGQQRAAMGMAVKFNPTDFLNPINLAEPLGEKLAVPMIKMDYYLPYNLQISGMVVPEHHPLLKVIPMNQTLPVTPIAPEIANVETVLALKGMGFLGGDFTLSYFRGFEDIPSVTMTQQGPKAGYRALQAVGVSAAYPVGDVGLWAEGAYMIPEGSFEEGYHEGVVGSDYRLSNGIYLMGQIIYRKDQLTNEYMIAQTAVEHTFMEIHKVRFGGMYDFKTEGYALLPELELSLSDNLLLLIGANIASGNLPLAQNGKQISTRLQFDF